jgi:glycosyltransferase involved in cell wall biosynthesis
MDSTFLAYKNKITNKLFGVVHMSAKGNAKGSVLLSYLTEPFTLLPSEKFSNLHTSYWECYEIARLLSERGYDVDNINWDNESFIPKKKYVACIDIQNNLERLSRHLNTDCKKIHHIVSSYPDFQNKAEQKRLDNLFNRRGIKLNPHRTVSSSKNPEIADYVEGLGNAAIWNTYKNFIGNKQIFPIPLSVVKEFDQSELMKRNISEAKKNFLWIGGGGMVHKGLDLLLEAVSTMPDTSLHICGPVAKEKDFTEAYKKELAAKNVYVYGRIDVTSNLFKEIITTCAAVMYPSCSEGTAGAVVQAMHAGLVPIITPETGIYENDFSIILNNPTVESLAEAMRDFSQKSDQEIQVLSKKTYDFAQSHYTRNEFSKAYSHFLDSVKL